ncbi:MAG: hypothetical protein S4CHLAM7_13070 [Chlamydiae bacterium]|nr:hypothetical protein [Chlamydiota bacterium]
MRFKILLLLVAICSTKACFAEPNSKNNYQNGFGVTLDTFSGIGPVYYFLNNNQASIDVNFLPFYGNYQTNKKNSNSELFGVGATARYYFPLLKKSLNNTSFLFLALGWKEYFGKQSGSTVQYDYNIWGSTGAQYRFNKKVYLTMTYNIVSYSQQALKKANTVNTEVGVLNWGNILLTYMF